MRIKAKLTFEKDAVQQLGELKKALRNRLIRKAVTAGLKDTRSTARRNAQLIRRTGGLAKSIGSKVKTYKNATAGIVGPRSDFTRTVDGRLYRPSKVAHLIERGTQHSRPRPWLVPALHESGPRFGNAVTDKLRELITEQLSK